MNGAPMLCIALCILGCGGSGSPASGVAPTDNSAISLIGEVQGAGDSSPMLGETVTVRGVVTGDFQDDDSDTARNLGGFYITGEPDASPATSDGVFVFDGDSVSRDVSVGDAVEVTGVVAEFFGETQLQSVTVAVTGRGNIQPARLASTVGVRQNSDGEFIPDLESNEGMLVRFANTLTVSDVFQSERYGELLLSADGRLMQFTQIHAPSVDGYADYQREVARRSILLDDGRRGQNERPAIYVTPQKPVRRGDQIQGLTGVLRYARGSGGSGMQTYRLMPTETVTIEQTNARPAAPNPGGSLRVASLNLLNYFSTIDTGADNCGPSGTDRCRGADSSSELARQQQKLVATIVGMDADIVGLVELENSADASLRSIVDSINASGANYTFVDAGVIGSDAIKVGIIYKPGRVTPAGTHAILDQSVDARFNDDKNRPVLAQTFTDADGGSVTIAVNHLKSKGSDCNDLGDPNQRDGQGECNLTRRAAAAAMADWLNADPTNSGDSDVLILGDLNAYSREDPVTAITERGYHNLITELEGTNSYSFVFRGQTGALDHAFASTSLASQVTGAAEWHINADEFRLFDYNEDGRQEPDWFAGDTPYRSSDHDPLVVGLQLTP